jgi:upstream activation factor subunit UAF30
MSARKISITDPQKQNSATFITVFRSRHSEMSGSNSSTDEAIVRELRKYLRGKNLEQTSLRDVYAHIETVLGVDDIRSRKSWLKAQVVDAVNYNSSNNNNATNVSSSQSTSSSRSQSSPISPSPKVRETAVPSSRQEKVAKDPKAKAKRDGSPVRRGGLHALMYLSEPLQTVLGVETASRPQIISLIWQYIKEHDLQDPENRQMINCDEAMQAVFGVDRIRTFGLSKEINKHVFYPDEIGMPELGVDEDGVRRAQEKRAEKRELERELEKEDPKAKYAGYAQFLVDERLSSSILDGDAMMSKEECFDRIVDFARRKGLLKNRGKTIDIRDELADAWGHLKGKQITLNDLRRELRSCMSAL